MENDGSIDQHDETMLEHYNNENDENSAIKNICISDAAAGNIIFQVNRCIEYPIDLLTAAMLKV